MCARLGFGVWDLPYIVFPIFLSMYLCIESEKSEVAEKSSSNRYMFTVRIKGGPGSYK